MSQRFPVSRLQDAGAVILPSMLLCDFSNLADEIRSLSEAGVQGLHLDVMDGHFVPNFTYGLPIVEAFRRATDMVLDVHLMISQPGRFIERFRSAGADLITIHVEATENPVAVLREIRSLGAAAGIALNPGTPLESIGDCLANCDLVLVMSVQPGFGGQSFQRVALEKLRQLRDRVGSNVLLEIDGGVNATTIADCAEAGARLFVVGSAIFSQPNYEASVAQLRRLVDFSGRTEKTL